MPRVNLTDEEAALIEKVRQKNAEALGFNAGIVAACNHIAHFTPREDETNWQERLINEVFNMKRDIKV